MAKPGPKPGFKRSSAQQLSAAPAAAPVGKASTTDTAPAPEPVRPSAADRENPDKLSGQELRELAHRRGIAFSSLCFMSDEKIRLQLRYITYRQYDDDAVG